MFTRIRTYEVRVIDTFVGMPAGPQAFDAEEDFAQWLGDNAALYRGDGPWQDYMHFRDDFDEIAVYTSQVRHVDQVESLARYFLEGPFAGECYGVTSPDAVEGWGHLFIIKSDSTKSRHDDWTMYMDDLWGMLRDGSPVRKTDRSGPGTKGTRAVDGLRCDLWLAFR